MNWRLTKGDAGIVLVGDTCIVGIGDVNATSAHIVGVCACEHPSNIIQSEGYQSPE